MSANFIRISKTKSVFIVFAACVAFFQGPASAQWTRSSPYVRLQYSTDRVGIGVTSPVEKLEVNGNIKCTAVKIGNWTLNAPDYVFEKDYELRSLDAVEKFIEEKKHLPEVPSAAEMKENGVDLSELNMTLLKKVEELTLYAIEQNKKLEQQQRQIEELNNRIVK